MIRWVQYCQLVDDQRPVYLLTTTLTCTQQVALIPSISKWSFDKFLLMLFSYSPVFWIEWLDVYLRYSCFRSMPPPIRNDRISWVANILFLSSFIFLLILSCAYCTCLKRDTTDNVEYSMELNSSVQRVCMSERERERGEEIVQTLEWFPFFIFHFQKWIFFHDNINVVLFIRLVRIHSTNNLQKCWQKI